MDALDRILPLAGLLWPLADCDASIRLDPSSACASTGVAYLARVFDADADPDAPALAEAVDATPSAAAEALASHLAALARPQLDALLRAAGYPTPDASTRADLAADVARLERGIADVTRERDGLRVQLQAAHRAAGEGVDLRRYVLRADVVALCDREERRCMDEWRPGAARDVARISALVSDLGGEHIESSEQQGVEGGEGHGGSR